MPELLDQALVKILEKDKDILAHTALPIITVSATFQEDLKKFYGFPDDDTTPDVVFSRAHYSMALAIAMAAWFKNQSPLSKNLHIDQNAAWIVDPTNYVSHQDWSSVGITQQVGETLARHPMLKAIKDFIDRFGRQKLPIIDSITPPLLYLTAEIRRPILSMHIAAGNVLASQGKTVVQMITDPHVRYDYLEHAEKKNLSFLVFDEQTKVECLEKAALMDKNLDPDRIIVTGPPVDPRVVACREKKRSWRSGPLKLCITTGGLGTNKLEIQQIIEQLLPELRKKEPKFKLIVYAATHDDIANVVTNMAKAARVTVGDLSDSRAVFRVLYHPQIVDANELLIRYAFPWAHGFVTKPSGDMAYDAVASGSFLLTLAEWGEWEHRIREIFEQKGVARALALQDVVTQLEVLTDTKGRSESWVEKAMINAAKIDPIFTTGAKNILEAFGLIERKFS